MASSETLRSVIDAGRTSKRLDELSSARVIGKIALQAHAAQQKAGSGKSIGPITPGHITFLPSGETKLETTATGGSSLGYSAPEQLTGGAGDRRSDVFSLGTVLWEALTYTRLFDAMNDAAVKVAVAEREIAAPSDINANIPAELSAICMRALARNPADRYSSLKSMAVEIEEFLEEAGYVDDDSRIAQYLKAMSRPAVAKPSPMAPAPAATQPAPAATQPAPAATQPAPAATQPLPLPLSVPATATPAPTPIPSKSVTTGWDAMPAPEAAPIPSTTKPVTAPPPTATPVGTRPPPMNAPAPAAPSILTDNPSEPARARKASGIDVANALATAGATTTALGVPAAPAPEDWQDKSAPSHPPMPAQTPMAPVLPGAATAVGKATIAASVAPQVKVATTVEAKHSDPKHTLVGTLLEPKTPAVEAKPATSAPVKEETPATAAPTKNGVDAAHATPNHPVTTAPVEAAPAAVVEAKPAETPPLEAKPAETPPLEAKPAEAPLEAKPAQANAAPPADDARTTLVDEKPPAAVVEAAAAEATSTGKPAGAGTKSEGAPAAPASAATSKPNPVDAVSLPGRESKADLLAGWGWGTGKHDALPPTGYTDDDDVYEHTNNRKPLIYAIGGGLGIALLVTIIAFAAGGSKDKKKPQNAKSTATDTTAANDTTARTQTPTPVEQPVAVEPTAPAVDPAAEKAAADKAAADKAAADKAAADKAAADKAAADKAAADKAAADKAAADAKLLAKQEAAKTDAEKKELAKQEAARKAEQAKQDKLLKEQAAKLARAEAAAKAEQARLAKQEASKQDAERKRLAREEAAKQDADKKRLAREEAAKQDAEKKRIAKEEAAKRPKTEPTTTVAKKEPKTEPRMAEKVVAKADRPKAEGKVDVETAYRIGLQQFARGETQAALASLRTSLAGNPNYAPTWRGLGLVFEKMGEKAQAKNAYKRYLQLAPTAGDAEIIRGRLERLGT